MFESAELGHVIDKASYKKDLPAMREALLEAQFDLHEHRRRAVVVLVNGVDGAGKGETVNLLNEWMDPRLIDTHAFDFAYGLEAEHPPMWRFWRALPAKGRIGVLFGSWYSGPILDLVAGKIDDAAMGTIVDEIMRLESMLVDEGVLLVKLWFHLSKKQQKARLKELESDPRTRWRVGEEDWAHFKQYDTFRAVSESVLLRTSTGFAPWLVIDGGDANYRSLTAGNVVLEALKRCQQESAPRLTAAPAPLLPPIDNLRVLDRLVLDQPTTKAEYIEALEHWQGKLNQLSRHANMKHHAVVAVFEGNDAAGKGGAIRRLTQALDARVYHVIPIAAPSEEERAQPYMWRFWRHLPRRGKFAIFDRSWYGRVLVERIEGFCAEADWMRAYGEINDFERQLDEHGVIVVKFWLAIDANEQLSRFKQREATGFKRFKITDEDWRNRDKWDAYGEAVHDMVERTSTRHAPWVMVEANNKYYARLKILRSLCDAIEARLVLQQTGEPQRRARGKQP